MSNRLAKVNSLVKRELGQLLQTSVERPDDFLITISRVETSVDLRYANIYVSVIPANRTGSALKFLRTHLRTLQKQLHRKLVMRPLPRLRIHIDPGERHAAKIEKILAEEKVTKERKEKDGPGS